MTPRWRLAGWPLALAVLALAAGCAIAPQPAVEGQVAAPGGPPRDWLNGTGMPYLFDAEDSVFTIRVYRDGRLARLGHNHVIEALGVTGRLVALADGAGAAELSIPVERLRVDDAAARARAGEDFAGMPDAAAIAGTRRNMLGPQLLDAATWPRIEVLARVADIARPRAEAEVYLSLRGIARHYRVPVTVERANDAIIVSGSLALQQTSLGITPFSVLGGALQVRDAVDVDFRIIGRKSRPAL